MISIILYSFIFLFLGLIMNENSAKYLLAGYNTMSEEERSKFDIESYIQYFKKINFSFALICIIVGFVCLKYLSENFTWIILTLLTICTSVLLVWKAQKLS